MLFLLARGTTVLLLYNQASTQEHSVLFHSFITLICLFIYLFIYHHVRFDAADKEEKFDDAIKKVKGGNKSK
jgi:membrane protein YdbS with pleckstrin-like domain